MELIQDILKKSADALLLGLTAVPILITTILIEKASKSSTSELSVDLMISVFKDLSLQRQLRGHWEGVVVRATEPGRGMTFPIEFDIPLMGKIKGTIGEADGESGDYRFGLEKLSDHFVRIDFREAKNKLYDQGTSVLKIKEESCLLEGYYLASIDVDVHSGLVELRRTYKPKLFNIFG
jgi:hypothetical protein